MPFNIWQWHLENTSWTCEFWHKKGVNFNTYSNGALLEASDTYGSGFSINFGQDNTQYSFRMAGMDNWTGNYRGNADSWNHIAVVNDEGNISFYVNGERKINNIVLNENPSSNYIPDKGFTIGFTSTSDYRDYSIAKVRFSKVARYTGESFTPSKAYTAD